MAEGKRAEKLKDPSSLSHKLLERSDKIHREAERRPFMVAFFKGQLPKESYGEWLARQWFVYSALEEVDDQLKDDPSVGRMYSPELHRRESLEKDLTFWIGDDWRSSVSETSAAKAYAERIREVGKDFPPAFVAHQWLRYLGNVLGQDMLKRLVSNPYGVTDEGLAFYQFPDVDDPKSYLGAYHARMNSIPLNDQEKDRVADEGVKAFELNIGLTDELASDFGIATSSKEEADKLVEKLSAEHP
jgi:heme oxygenase